MTEVRPARPDQFEEIYPLLLEFSSPTMERDDWQRMLFDLPWSVEEPHRGYILYEGAKAVGFLGTIFSRREIGGRAHRFCNLSSWIVRDSHRGAALQLVLPVLALKSHTIVNLTASPGAHEIFSSLGFRTLETAQVLLPPFARPLEFALRFGSSVATRAEAIRPHLDDDGRRILDDMAGTRATQILVRRGRRQCHVVATLSPWKGGRKLAHIQYASDWEFLWARPGDVSLALLRTCGTLGLRLDARHVRRLGPRPALAIERALAQPTLYRPAGPEITPELVDGLYTELVGQRW